MGGALAALVVGAALLSGSTPPSPATSPGEPAPALVSYKRAFCLYTGCFLEPLLPDLRRELGPNGGWVLSWPVHPLPLPYLDLSIATLHASPFLEPQLGVGEWDFRMLGGLRLSLFPSTSRFGVLLEGAGILERAGLGAVLGAGLTYDLIERHQGTFPWTVAIVGRRTTVSGAARFDVSLDVTVPLPLLGGVRPWGEKGEEGMRQ